MLLVEDEYEKLKHNIAPTKEGIEPTYVKKKFEVNRQNGFREPDKRYRMHTDDVPGIKRGKKIKNT